MQILVNNRSYEIETDPETPLLWVIRDILGLKGTKFGCGLAQCGACTVHLNGEAIRSCSVPVEIAKGKEVTTIEGLSKSGEHPLQEAWVENSVPQCGYCQPGQLMNAAAFLAKKTDPTSTEVKQAMSGPLQGCMLPALF